MRILLLVLSIGLAFGQRYANLPGVGFINETGTRQVAVQGGSSAFINETISGSTPTVPAGIFNNPIGAAKFDRGGWWWHTALTVAKGRACIAVQASVADTK